MKKLSLFHLKFNLLHTKKNDEMNKNGFCDDLRYVQ